MYLSHGCTTTWGPSAVFLSSLVLKVKGLGAVFSNRIAVLVWIYTLATHIRSYSFNTCAGANNVCKHIYTPTHTHAEKGTTRTSAEQEVVRISTKYHKMVAEAFFFSPPLSLWSLITIWGQTRGGCTKLFLHSPASCSSPPSFLPLVLWKHADREHDISKTKKLLI